VGGFAVYGKCRQSRTRSGSPNVVALIAGARPLIASFESIRLIPVGGKGLAP
jgi:hypothetical protein